ncbi:hypothetical protein ACSNOK_30890, partial [Streptomyces sp. URMC 126]|uniref:hypothetical protein n=1 Tax=Streptomyces sp. URMC 126 TaxID=3423401 RepID=UPI003F1A682A
APAPAPAFPALLNVGVQGFDVLSDRPSRTCTDGPADTVPSAVLAFVPFVPPLPGTTGAGP